MAAGANPDGPEMGALLDVFSPDASYVDVPSGGVWRGRDEIKGIVVSNYAWANDQVLTFTRRLIDGHEYVLEGAATGTNSSALGERGRRYVLPFVWVGSFDDEGRVQEQRDYWDTKMWLVQIGAEEAGRADST
jgi:ketosteroid isomerase-like protein